MKTGLPMEKPHLNPDFSTKTGLPVEKPHLMTTLSIERHHFMEKPYPNPDFSTGMPFPVEIQQPMKSYGQRLSDCLI